MYYKPNEMLLVVESEPAAGSVNRTAAVVQDWKEPEMSRILEVIWCTAVQLCSSDQDKNRDRNQNSDEFTSETPDFSLLAGFI